MVSVWGHSLQGYTPVLFGGHHLVETEVSFPTGSGLHRESLFCDPFSWILTKWIPLDTSHTHTHMIGWPCDLWLQGYRGM